MRAERCAYRKIETLLPEKKRFSVEMSFRDAPGITSNFNWGVRPWNSTGYRRFAGAVLFAELGLLVGAKSRTIEEISYPQYLLVFPMFLFCGVFFPLSTLPVYLQWLAWTLPLTSIVSLVRTLTLGTPLQLQVFVVIALWLAVLVPWSRQAMTRRLIK